MMIYDLWFVKGGHKNVLAFDYISSPVEMDS